jgi:epoxyqueuosine reductase
MNKTELSAAIKQQAEVLGFLSCGIAKVEFLEQEARYLEDWLKNGYQGKMSYMENHFDKRLNPALLVDGAKSVISVLVNYFPQKDLFLDSGIKISKYAYGEDYHIVIRDRLQELLNFIEATTGERSARIFTDSAPVLDKAWAERSGLGWIGKNGNLLSKKKGSFFFIGEIIIDLELDCDQPIQDHCGSCTKCIDACPTDAIIKPNLVDGSKCISYLTIELKDEIIPNEFKGKMDNWVFGCDVCQDVCPWNRFSTPHSFPEFDPHDNLSEEELREISEESFKTIFRNSAVKRTKFSGLKRNIEFLS